jgi:hypothetical protein
MVMRSKTFPTLRGSILTDKAKHRFNTRPLNK